MTTTLDKPGTVMPDGSIYAGVSPDTGKPIYATPKDVPMHCNFNQAADYAATLDAHGRKDWRVPTKAELNVLFGTARRSAASTRRVRIPPVGTGRPRATSAYLAWAQRFSGGYQEALAGATSQRCAVSGDE